MSTEKTYTLHLGDCREVLKTLPANSIDAVVTDPPYGLSFMGKGWDHGVPGVDFWTEVYRVMKPGAHLIAYGGTRTIHRLTVGIEDARFEIRDSIYWLYGSGFPKSHNVSKAIDSHLGAEREVIGETLKGAQQSSTGTYGAWGDGITPTAPGSPEAAQWDGWGTALKPAVEPAVLARKPLSGTVAQNVLQYGTGGINIDGCRVGDENTLRPNSNAGSIFVVKDNERKSTGSSSGRWPANILLDEVSAEMMDQQSGESNSNIRRSDDSHSVSGSTFHIQRDGITPRGHLDSGGASRFFYIAKASSTEREIGLQGMEKKNLSEQTNHGNMMASKWITDPRSPNGGYESSVTPPRANHHPTVKPLQLMQYMIRLITPPGGTVLDPFMGSGSTGAACMLEGVQFIGIDITPEYIEIAEKRISYWRQRAFTPVIDAPLNVPKSIIKPVHSAQQTLDLED